MGAHRTHARVANLHFRNRISAVRFGVFACFANFVLLRSSFAYVCVLIHTAEFPSSARIDQSPYEGLSAVNGLVVDGAYLDGSWELCVHVEDLNDVVCVRVRGDTSVGGLMHHIVEAVNVKQSWSDHAIWWPQRNVWLLHTRTSLDQYGVQSDAQLVFRHTHGNLQVVLPSLATLTLRVNFASRVFSVVEGICKELCIRHPEELSLMCPVTRDTIKRNQPLPVIRHGVKRTGPLNPIGAVRSEMPAAASNGVKKMGSLNPLNDSNPYPTLPYGSATLMRGQSDNSLYEERTEISKFLDCSQRKSAKVAFGEEWLLKPKNVQQKARMDGRWLDSSRSLMEHGIEPPTLPLGEHSISQPKPPILYLRFKFYNFYDINTNYDAVRIHQIYEQARWSLLSGNLECTEDEMIVFAAYQLQAELQNESALRTNAALYSCGAGGGTLARCNTLGGYNTPASQIDPGLRPMSPDFSTPRSFGGSLSRMPSLGTVAPPSGHSRSLFIGSNSHLAFNDDASNEMDEIDVLLTELEQSCNVFHQPRKSSTTCHDVVDSSTAPILQDSIKVFRDKGLLPRRSKEMWGVVKGVSLVLYRDPHNVDSPSASYTLRDCLITPDLSPENSRFAVKLSLIVTPPSSSSTAISRRCSRTREEVWLRFNSMEQYARWVAAFRLAGRGKSLESRAALDNEFRLVRETLEKQSTTHATPVLSPEELTTHLGDLSDFCTERIIKRARSREALRQRISEIHAGFRDLSLQDAKLRYIEQWQRLNHFGRSYFIVQFDKGNPFGLGSPSGGIFSSPGPQEGVIAIRQFRIEVVSSSTEETQLAWNFADLRSWNVNWDNGRVILEFRNGKVSFKPLSANCKNVVEFIGGYVFLSQRNLEKNQKLDERLFHKLTGASD
ncbi:FERM central domain [Echinococcus multilocularis]|uniref:FERM central domain n=1 Tax=Echinococcus multilocularis TaxID=6211 RepID=A0A087VX22_ECHMU|nr:FERM central domain [Echinococcus multilocularis]